jgi:hypothetical protein
VLSDARYSDVVLIQSVRDLLTLWYTGWNRNCNLNCYGLMVTHLTTFVRLFSWNNITLQISGIPAVTRWWKYCVLNIHHIYWRAFWWLFIYFRLFSYFYTFLVHHFWRHKAQLLLSASHDDVYGKAEVSPISCHLLYKASCIRHISVTVYCVCVYIYIYIYIYTHI